jgi:hypothetical protein
VLLVSILGSVRVTSIGTLEAIQEGAGPLEQGVVDHRTRRFTEEKSSNAKRKNPQKVSHPNHRLPSDITQLIEEYHNQRARLENQQNSLAALFEPNDSEVRLRSAISEVSYPNIDFHKLNDYRKDLTDIYKERHSRAKEFLASITAEPPYLFSDPFSHPMRQVYTPAV